MLSYGSGRVCLAISCDNDTNIGIIPESASPNPGMNLKQESGTRNLTGNLYKESHVCAIFLLIIIGVPSKKLTNFVYYLALLLDLFEIRLR